ncbi:uncharacterized protein LOC131481113 [Ochotona princeps]|uniref:uncharacterized protein LOC131481113 n=1 Tax=Ochotona princeps TaxID=9978 RepID=UPI002714AEDE|nr:uncharacterized protein LOC131481113 [Ochotona princeps]
MTHCRPLCLRSEPLVPTRRVSHRTVAKTSPEPHGSEEPRPKAPAGASSPGRTPAQAAERNPQPGTQLLQLPLKFAVAAASSRFNPRPPVIGQLLRGKKSTPWQPDKPIKSPAGVTAATLQAGVGLAEEPEWPLCSGTQPGSGQQLPASTLWATFLCTSQKSPYLYLICLFRLRRRKKWRREMIIDLEELQKKLVNEKESRS